MAKHHRSPHVECSFVVAVNTILCTALRCLMNCIVPPTIEGVGHSISVISDVAFGHLVIGDSKFFKMVIGDSDSSGDW